MLKLFFLVLILGSPSSFAFTEPNWNEGVVVPQGGRANIYQLAPDDLKNAVREGKFTALEYPVNISGILMPYRPFKKFIEDPSLNPLRLILQNLFQGFTGITSVDEIWNKVGLHTYPASSSDEGVYEVPVRPSRYPKGRMGVTFIEHDGVETFTLSCVACHSANLFGKRVIGMTNRFPRSNEFFLQGKKAVGKAGPSLFRAATGATKAEAKVYDRLRDRVQSIGAKPPQTEGLDTSLAQVALSLSRRSPDEYASFDERFSKTPRPEPLAHESADSKPAVWWNVKYKNRWLSDGSVVSGNPIFTNFLWNEIGRGTDLRELEDWLAQNTEKIRNLTATVFATEAPRYTDFFPAESIRLDSAKRGQKVFDLRCAKCHGTYEKKWDLPQSDSLTLTERLETKNVSYHAQTPVRDVGTDAKRYIGMKSLEIGLNPLAISRSQNAVIKAQKGYVPPPLVGIWARWPYFHNNSVPNLCALLTRSEDRPKKYWAGEALNPSKDFDTECVGYPLDEKTPAEWKKNPERLYDAAKEGLSNQGHDEKIFLDNGEELLTPTDKRDLIEYLKTL